MIKKKPKYYYNEKSAQYERHKTSGWRIFSGGVFFFFLSALMGWGFFLISTSFFNSPKELMLKKEVDFMGNQYSILEKKVDLLSDVLGELEKRDNTIYRAYFEAEPISEDIRKAGYGGVNRNKHLEGYSTSPSVIELTEKVEKLSKQMAIQSNSYNEIGKLAKEKEKLLRSIPAIMPIAKKDLKRIASGFGMRLHPILKIYRLHAGLDFTAPTGTPIYAAADGKITKAKRSSSYGNVIDIDHGYGYLSRYAHLHKMKLREGQRVKRGDIIGYVGSTGLSSGPHLHYEIHKNGNPINPVYFFYKDISPDDYVEFHEEASIINQSLD